jgi:hypothetical protein
MVIPDESTAPIKKEAYGAPVVPVLSVPPVYPEVVSLLSIRVSGGVAVLKFEPLLLIHSKMPRKDLRGGGFFGAGRRGGLRLSAPEKEYSDSN